MVRKQLVSMPLGVATPIPMHASTGTTRTIFRSWSPVTPLESADHRRLVPMTTAGGAVAKNSMTSGMPASRSPDQIWVMDSDWTSSHLLERCDSDEGFTATRSGT